MSTLLTIRAALIFVAGIVVGAIAFALAYHASPTRNCANAALVGGGALGAAVIFFNEILGT